MSSLSNQPRNKRVLHLQTRKIIDVRSYWKINLFVFNRYNRDASSNTINMHLCRVIAFQGSRLKDMPISRLSRKKMQQLRLFRACKRLCTIKISLPPLPAIHLYPLTSVDDKLFVNVARYTSWVTPDDDNTSRILRPEREKSILDVRVIRILITLGTFALFRM